MHWFLFIAEYITMSKRETGSQLHKASHKDFNFTGKTCKACQHPSTKSRFALQQHYTGARMREICQN